VWGLGVNPNVVENLANIGAVRDERNHANLPTGSVPVCARLAGVERIRMPALERADWPSQCLFGVFMHSAQL
jgi:hypothetical protein